MSVAAFSPGFNADAKGVRLRLVGVLVVAMAPHVFHLPPWVMGFAAALIIWQVLAILGDYPQPGRGLRLFLCAVIFAGVYLFFGRVNGQQAGASLLVLMLALKLTELHTRRDKALTLFLAYFVLITQFLFSQSIVMGIYMLIAAWLITASLLEISHSGSPLSIKRKLKSSAVLLGQSLPLMVLLFVLFPRIPGPLWGLPKPNNTGITGLNDRMAPDSISRLALNNSIAFRVTFQGKAPARAKMYWRGPVLEHYNGTTWTRTQQRKSGPPRVDKDADFTTYEVILEPSDTRLLPTLALPVSGPPRAIFTETGQMMAQNPVNERRLYHASSILDYRFQLHLGTRRRAMDLALPPGIDPESRKLIHRWQAQGLHGMRLARRVLRFIHDKPFYYTLQPPRITGKNKVDQFLFQTRRGFCEHYASAFTVLMRMAGIPARVVTGYYGGEYNHSGNYFIIRQSSAHAWSEIWLQGRGWVRIDPTSAIASGRVEVTQSTGGAGTPGVAPIQYGGSFWHSLSLHWDWVKTTWTRTLLAYGPELQSAFLSRFGLPDKRAMLLALTGLSVSFLTLLGILLMWRARPDPHRGDPVAKAWDRFCRRLARRGLPRAPHEGPQDYARRIAEEHPALADDVRPIAELYIGLRYRNLDDPRLRQRFFRRIRSFRWKKKRPAS